MEEFSEVEKQYIEYKLSGANLSKEELAAKFGGDLPHLESEIKIARYLADFKLKKAKRKNSIDYLCIPELQDLVVVAADIAKRALYGEELNQQQVMVALALVKPGISFMTKTAEGNAEIQVGASDKGKVGPTLNIYK